LTDQGRDSAVAMAFVVRRLVRTRRRRLVRRPCGLDVFSVEGTTS